VAGLIGRNESPTRFTEIDRSGAARPRVDGATPLSAYYDRRVLEHAPEPPRTPQPRWGETHDARTYADPEVSSRSIYPLRGVDRDETRTCFAQTANQKGAPRPRVWDRAAAPRAYNPGAWEISTRQGLLGSTPGVIGSTTKLVIHTRARERRGDDGRPPPDMAKTTPRGVVRTG
jgi:hypothetical protein